MRVRIGKTTIECVQGDITRQQVDAIVNAANSRLIGGGGVDGAIHRAGGPTIMRECDKIREDKGGCPTGRAVMTSAGDLRARTVIHAVGPIYKDGAREDQELLAGAYRDSLRLATEAEYKSIAFPSISTGAYGYPVDAAARVALSAILDFVRGETTLTQIRMVLFDRDTFEAYRRTLASILPTKRY